MFGMCMQPGAVSRVSMQRIDAQMRRYDALLRRAMAVQLLMLRDMRCTLKWAVDDADADDADDTDVIDLTD